MFKVVFSRLRRLSSAHVGRRRRYQEASHWRMLEKPDSPSVTNSEL
jgi:hypothetical protein